MEPLKFAIRIFRNAVFVGLKFASTNSAVQVVHRPPEESGLEKHFSSLHFEVVEGEEKSTWLVEELPWVQ